MIASRGIAPRYVRFERSNLYNRAPSQKLLTKTVPLAPGPGTMVAAGISVVKLEMRLKSAALKTQMLYWSPGRNRDRIRRQHTVFHRNIPRRPGGRTPSTRK